MGIEWRVCQIDLETGSPATLTNQNRLMVILHIVKDVTNPFSVCSVQGL